MVAGVGEARTCWRFYPFDPSQNSSAVREQCVIPTSPLQKHTIASSVPADLNLHQPTGGGYISQGDERQLSSMDKGRPYVQAERT